MSFEIIYTYIENRYKMKRPDTCWNASLASLFTIIFYELVWNESFTNLWTTDIGMFNVSMYFFSDSPDDSIIFYIKYFKQIN